MRLDKRITSYVGDETSTIDEIRPTLWTEVDASAYAGAGEHYQAAILEQYRIYVEMADRTSARRSTTNTFFLTLNTLVFAALGVLWRDRPAAAEWYLVVPLIPLVVQCGAWFWLVRSYRQINSAKYIVIGALEERLPASPYWRAEWRALGEGRVQPRYWPLTQLEQLIPILFAVAYLAGFVVALVA